MALHCSEFIRRFLMHVLPKGLMRIRHYGILANRCREPSITMIRAILSTPAPEQTNTTTCEAVTYLCPKCRKGQLIPKHKITPVHTWGHPQPG